MSEKDNFNVDLIKNYPHANKKIELDIGTYALEMPEEEIKTVDRQKGQTTFISPYGIEFHVTKDYPKGTLLKIKVSIPDYWHRKKQLVDYSRIDNPDTFRILGKVVRTEETGKRGKKKIITVQTVNIDEVDEQILKTFLQENK